MLMAMQAADSVSWPACRLLFFGCGCTSIGEGILWELIIECMCLGMRIHPCRPHQHPRGGALTMPQVHVTYLAVEVVANTNAAVNCTNDVELRSMHGKSMHLHQVYGRPLGLMVELPARDLQWHYTAIHLQPHVFQCRSCVGKCIRSLRAWLVHSAYIGIINESDDDRSKIFATKLLPDKESGFRDKFFCDFPSRSSDAIPFHQRTTISLTNIETDGHSSVFGSGF